MAESLCEELGKEILNLSEDIAKKKIDKAQYDKSYNAVILGVNQNFVDDVPDKDKSELISKHSIPETADNGKYYTFKINGVYYVKKSNTDFKLYEDVVIRVPNGNWNNMFIEVQRDTVNDSGESPIGDFGKVSFEKNRMYYNGETYHVQYGINKRIMCVTKGDKYALISSTDPIDSRIEAATAVMKGLTEDWDIEFDYYGLEWADGITLDISAVMGNYSGRVRCDWGDGTVDENTSHIYYNVGAVTVKVKLLDTVSGTISVNLGASQWNNSNNKLCTEKYIGARAYIGGSIENVQISHGQGVTHICFGEKIKSISGHGIYQIAEGYNEMGIPPFIENISDNAYFYSGIDYIYIPESCVSIGDYAFYYNSASEIEIEEKGDTLTIGDYAFANTADTSAVFNRVDVIRIPARVIKGGTNDIFIRCSAGTVIFGRGRTEIPEYMCRAAYASPTFSEISKRPFFVFIPKTVKTIGNQFISDSGYSEYVNNPVYIICEGKWNNITKASNWDGANGSRENVTIIENDELYRSADKIINTFIRRS